MALTSGTKLGPYDIQSLIGAGGMGEVYRAHDSRLNRTVAIKVLPRRSLPTATVCSASHRKRVRQRPSTIPIFFPSSISARSKARPMLSRSCWKARPFANAYGTDRCPSRRVVDYALQVARGLGGGARKRHRASRSEAGKSFSDQRWPGEDSRFRSGQADGAGTDDRAATLPTVQVATEAGVVMGTAGYMSPEQVRGKLGRSPLRHFRFGAILYEMISGKRAFHGETSADTMSAILKEETPELSETARNVPPGLERIVRHCLEKHPAQRFQSAGDLAFDLEALTDVSAATKSGAQAAVQQASVGSSRRQLAAAAGVIVFAAAMLGLGWWLGRGKGPTPLRSIRQITFRTGFIGNARYTPDGSIVYSASWDGGDFQLYLARTDDTVSRELGLKDAELLAISKSGELAVRLDTVFLNGYARIGTLARVPLGGGTPREVLENVQDADWSARWRQHGRCSLCRRRTATGASSIRSAMCCWTALIGSVIRKSRPTAGGSPLPITKIPVATTKARSRSWTCRDTRRNSRQDGFRCRDSCGLPRAMRFGLPPRHRLGTKPARSNVGRKNADH